MKRGTPDTGETTNASAFPFEKIAILVRVEIFFENRSVDKAPPTRSLPGLDAEPPAVHFFTLEDNQDRREWKSGASFRAPGGILFS
jgi:hypothetical protein